MDGIRVEIQEPDFWVIGVTFSVFFNKGKESQFNLIGNSSYLSSI